MKKIIIYCIFRNNRKFLMKYSKYKILLTFIGNSYSDNNFGFNKNKNITK